MEVCILKVKIGLRANGEADHPNWSSLPLARGDWGKVRGQIIDGWKYDHDCGHQEARANGDEWDSPYGMQWGCLMVTELFCRQALFAFPNECAQIDEARFQTFYDNYHSVRMVAETVDADVLQGLKNRVVLEKEISPQGPRLVELHNQAVRALNPSDSARGVRTNRRKQWSTFKTMIGVTQVRDPGSM